MTLIDLANYDVVYRRPEALTNVQTHYCPGCTHGLIHRLIGEVIDELGIRENTICVAPVGCAVFAYNYFNVDGCEAPHGRAPAMATGIKRVMPDRVVFTYQGDGDLAAIGTNEIIHAAGRGEDLTVIFVNNANYGMTGGQMAPTTLVGQVTTSSPYGRDVELVGMPMRVAELISTIPGASYVDTQADVIVPDAQLSLAIGKEGQNARLAARLTGVRIDIRGESQPEDGLDDDADYEEGEWVQNPETGEMEWHAADGSVVTQQEYEAGAGDDAAAEPQAAADDAEGAGDAEVAATEEAGGDNA